MTPTWVHFDRRYFGAACGGTAGFPLLKMGSRSTYVLVLQDALNALGYNARYLDGIFGNATKDALVRFQRNNGLSADGICGCSSWRKLVSMVVGIGRTPTVIDMVRSESLLILCLKEYFRIDESLNNKKNVYLFRHE